ncbi:MAG TPA: hypothetical protein VEG36_07095 [Burkholderiales bacterium]|nr:hypothetical protein [Burkholderiales bacterium]
MPVDIKLVRGHEFVMTRADDSLDFEASKAMAERLAGTLPAPCALLVDLREADAAHDVLELYRLCELLAARCRTAMLAAAGEHAAKPRFAQLVAEGGGRRLRAFTSLDEALAWLASPAV